MFKLNTTIWNNQEVYDLTLYSIEDIKEELISLTKFISENLVPNKLKYFDVEALKNIKNVEGIKLS